MISIVRSFGAPVIEPPGNSACKASQGRDVGAQPARIVVISWCTEGYDSTCMRSVTSTVPGSHTCDMSLRSRSTIIRFSPTNLGRRAAAPPRPVPLRIGVARGRALDRPRLDDLVRAVGTDRREPLGRAAEHAGVAVPARTRRTAPGSAAAADDRCRPGRREDDRGPVRQVGLVGVAEPQLALHLVERARRRPPRRSVSTPSRRRVVGGAGWRGRGSSSASSARHASKSSGGATANTCRRPWSNATRRVGPQPAGIECGAVGVEERGQVGRARRTRRSRPSPRIALPC